MNILRVFGIGSRKILALEHTVDGKVTKIIRTGPQIKTKAARLYASEQNTLYSHFITFEYSVNRIPYQGTLYIHLRYRCPQLGETITVYYDPQKPGHCACHSFGPRYTI